MLRIASVSEEASGLTDASAVVDLSLFAEISMLFKTVGRDRISASFEISKCSKKLSAVDETSLLSVDVGWGELSALYNSSMRTKVVDEAPVLIDVDSSVVDKSLMSCVDIERVEMLASETLVVYVPPILNTAVDEASVLSNVSVF